jgi:CheY-like chemotaxis protein
MDGILPLMKFPTTLIVVDDNIKFLNSLKLNIGEEIKYKVFTSATEALPFIQQQESALRSLVKKYFTVSIEDVSQPKPVIHFDLNTLHQILYDPNRFALSTVVVTDYAMPDMNGLELGEKLKNRLLKIIMLTGEAGYDMAVNGFNKSIIDQFILKSDINFLEQTKKFVLALETKLFAKLSHSVMDAISGNSPKPFADAEFIQFFNTLIEKHQIVEYYALDESGSYLLINAGGEASWLIVKNEIGMRVLYELAEGDNHPSPAVLAALKNKQKLAFFPSSHYEMKPACEWRLEKAHHLKTSQDSYYYSLVPQDDYYSVDTAKLFPYANFLNT